ncbi:hypothetical protein WR164_13970 [Philodulcilactobacillus myokoensis]|uniref:Lysine transporter LysE n=1 Tax=Philodulcilactobacillus myokoensis TaxID=2929573 RepID=A0A9W6B2G9_9LACO|nr:LysE family transporter [Philodulcilactobacillus myokoensis]GLB47418.1 hypothetical protein WR164_13970 [Philodulcilactobacillus myokoensis]
MLGFLSYVTIMAITPGPNNLMALQECRIRGLKGSRAFLLGLFVSFFILDFIALFLTSSMKAISPVFLIILKLIGSLYLAYLIYSLFVSSGKSNQRKRNSSHRFWAGMAVNLTNFKVMLYFLIGYVSFLFPIFQHHFGIIFTWEL